MIRRVVRGHSTYGLLKYLYGPGRRNEHTDIHLIASWDGNPGALEPDYLDEFGRHDVAPLVNLLEQPVKACDRAPGQYVYHLVFRNDPGDRRLTDAEWGEVCVAAMDATGIAPSGDPAGCRWVAVRHADDHIHLVATLAREDGRPPRIWGDYRALGRIANTFEQRFGLRTTLGWDDGTAAARPGVQEQVTAERAGRTVAPRVELRRRVHAAAATSGDFEQFTAQLAAQGVTVWPRYSDRNPGEITGYSVSLTDWTTASGEPVRFGGGKLAPDLSLPKLRARWIPDTTQPRRSIVGSAPRAANVGAPTGDADVWRAAERIVRTAADRLRATSPTAPDLAADAAWATGDVLAAAAATIEGERGGPLTDAADAFARAGRDLHRRAPARTDSGTALRAAARLLAITGGSRSASSTAALTLALTSLTAAVADLRRAEHRYQHAQAAQHAARLLHRRPTPLARTVRPPSPAATVDPRVTGPGRVGRDQRHSSGRILDPAQLAARRRKTADQHRQRGPSQ